MAVITVYEFGATGVPSSNDVTIADLSTQKARTQDASTSTSVESIDLKSDTRAVIIVADAAHRVSLVDSTCATTYFDLGEVGSGVYREDFGVKGGQTLYYRSEA